jgi:hypothetical protein
MSEKLSSKSATALPPFEVLMAITSEFLYEYNLLSIKVNTLGISQTHVPAVAFYISDFRTIAFWGIWNSNLDPVRPSIKAK